MLAIIFRRIFFSPTSRGEFATNPENRRAQPKMHSHNDEGQQNACSPNPESCADAGAERDQKLRIYEISSVRLGRYRAQRSFTRQLDNSKVYKSLESYVQPDSSSKSVEPAARLAPATTFSISEALCFSACL